MSTHDPLLRGGRTTENGLTVEASTVVDGMTEHAETPCGPTGVGAHLVTPALRFQTDLDVRALPFARFATEVAAAGFAHHSAWQWTTDARDLDAVGAQAVSTSRTERTQSALLDLELEVGAACLAWVHVGGDMLVVQAASRDAVVLDAAETWLRARFPEAVRAADQVVRVSFWSESGSGGYSYSRRLAVPSWDEACGNYPRSVRNQLSSLVAATFQSSDSGKLLLWHGPPGTGKTNALRALAWEWREWCDLHCITDPEELFGRSSYMLEVLLDEDDEDDDARWRLLVLEDTGELLAADAKERTGQGLSRLLNVVDGMIGQGLRFLVLVTTNEEIGSLHEAVSRPGRCAFRIEFAPFPADEADSWRAARGDAPLGRAATLAELFSDEIVPQSPRRRPGFVSD